MLSNLLGMSITILDGGLSCDLFLNGNVDKQKMNSDPLWIGRVLIEDPAEIRDSHIRFIEAGSDVIITGSYQCSVEGFVQHAGLSEADAIKLIGSTVDIAKEAIDISKTENAVQIAASISPYGATLHDLSEYSGTYIDSVTSDFLQDFHSVNIDIFLEKGVKLFAIETIPALKEAVAALKNLEKTPEAKAFVTFTTKDGLTTSYGDDFIHVFQTLSENKQVIGIGTNCSPAESVLVTANLVEKYLGSHQKFLCYPNQNFDSYFGDQVSNKESLSYKHLLKSWLKTGLFGFIGGCCMVEPKHIKELKEEIKLVQSKEIDTLSV